MVTAATLAAGFRNYSRTMMALAGEKISLTEQLLALIVDKLSILAWQNTEDGQHNRNFPPSIFEALTEEKEECEGFETGDDFINKWSSL